MFHLVFSLGAFRELPSLLLIWKLHNIGPQNRVFQMRNISEIIFFFWYVLWTWATKVCKRGIHKKGMSKWPILVQCISPPILIFPSAFHRKSLGHRGICDAYNFLGRIILFIDSMKWMFRDTLKIPYLWLYIPSFLNNHWVSGGSTIPFRLAHGEQISIIVLLFLREQCSLNTSTMTSKGIKHFWSFLRSVFLPCNVVSNNCQLFPLFQKVWYL